MIIALPLDDTKENICVSFGRTPYFLFYDSETKKEEIKENPAAEAEGGAGLKAAQFVCDNNCDILITVRCGENAAEVLKLGEVKIYKSIEGRAKENIEAFLNNKLNILEKFHKGFHGLS